MAVELSQKQQKILIEYCEKIKGMDNKNEYEETHQKFIKIPQFEFLKDKIPPVQEDWNDFRQTINKILSGEAEDYRKAYGDQETPAFERFTKNTNHELTPSEFIKTALKLQTVEEYGRFYNEHIGHIKKGTIRQFTNDLLGLYNEGADVPHITVSNNAKGWAVLYKAADSLRCDVNNMIPTPEDIRINGLDYLHETEIKMGQNMSVEYQENEIGSPGIKARKENEKEEAKLDTFAINAMVMGTLVPPFVMKIEDKFVDFTGFRFEKMKDMGTVVLMKKNHDGTDKKILIDSSFYNSIIENTKIIANAPAVTPEVIAKYEQAAYLDRDKLRENASANFWHNYRVMCRQNATNESDAMKIANEILSKMPTVERLFMEKQMKAYNKAAGTGKAYNQRLLDYYNENVKDLPVTRSIFSKESPQLVSDSYHDIVQKTGEKIDKNSSMKIGGVIKMSFDYEDVVSGKKQKLPSKEFVIVASSEEKNKVVLVDRESLSKYTLPRDEFLERTRKHEKAMKKEQKREQKKEQKHSLDFSY